MGETQRERVHQRGGVTARVRVGGSRWEVILRHPFGWPPVPLPPPPPLQHAHRMPRQPQLLRLNAGDVKNPSGSAIRAADC